jgi:glycine hydroxymethyltransferase
MRGNQRYGGQVIRNAQALGAALTRRGLPIVAADSGFTLSHTVLMQVAEYGTGREVAQLLEEADVMASYTRLPRELGSEGVRLGTSEVTRLGADEDAMAAAAGIVADVVQEKTSPNAARESVHRWAGRLSGIRYAELG